MEMCMLWLIQCKNEGKNNNNNNISNRERERERKKKQEICTGYARRKKVCCYKSK